MTNIRDARKVLSSIIESAGYTFVSKMSDYGTAKVKNAVITADVTPAGLKGTFTINTGVDHTLPEDERSRRWREYGAALRSRLEAAKGIEIVENGSDNHFFWVRLV